MSEIERIEKELTVLENLESYNKEEQATILASIIAQIVVSIPRDQLVGFFKSMIMSNADLLDNLIDFFKSKLLKEYREAIKRRRREIRIKRI
jgi:hypothetical protein